MELLRVEDLKVQFKNEESNTEAVSGISFSVKKGQCLGIVGESGSGKSTAMRALMGLLPEQTELSVRQLKRKENQKLAMIFQDPSACLNPSLSIGWQLMETIRLHRCCKRREARAEAVKLLDQVGIRNPVKRLSQYPFELSGGMKQRVVIAIALASQPDILIADEPTTALDGTTSKQILDLLRRIVQETAMSIILVTHDLLVAAAFCDEIMVMKAGRIVEAGEVQEVFKEPENEYTKALLYDARELERGDRDGGSAETFGIVGESGGGKTTLAKKIVKTRSQNGEQVQMIFQHSYESLNPRLTMGAIIEEGILYQEKYTKAERTRKVDEMICLTGLDIKDKQKYPHQFSGGQQQRIGIARALISNPQLIVCDEPVSSLDMTIQMQILRLLKTIQRRKKLSYFFISHDLNVIRYMSQRMGVMYDGEMVESGDTQEIYQDPWHPYTKELLTATLVADPRKARRKKWIPVKEEAHKTPTGCPYVGRCGYAMACCGSEKPKPYRFGHREVACFLYSQEHGAPRSPDYIMTTQI